MSYEVYTNDVIEARKYEVPNTSIEENCARMGARRVAWAVAHWWREGREDTTLLDCNCMQCCPEIPDSLQHILEQEAPD